MANSLFPAFFRLTYKTAQSTHIATIPTREWTPGGGGGAGSFSTWAGPQIDADVMIGGYVDLLLPFCVASTSFINSTVYTMDSPTDPPRPRAFLVFTGKVGTSVNPAQPASMGQYVFRTVTFGLLKIVFLDQPVTVNFLPISVVTTGEPLEDLSDYLVADANAFAGRDGGQPLGFVHATFKLNDELRKQYGYA